VVVGTLPTGRVTACNGQRSEPAVVHDHIRLRQHQISAVACIGVRLARHVKHPGTTERGETMSGSSCGGQLSAGGGSTKMISDGRSHANRKVLVQCVCEHLLPTAQARWLRRPGPLVAAPRAGDRHIDLFRYLIPGKALIAQLNDLLRGGGMGGRSAGNAWRDLGEPSKARQFYERGLLIARAELPKYHPSRLRFIRALHHVAPDLVMLDDGRIVGNTGGDPPR
jgi:hypothetical protein